MRRAFLGALVALASISGAWAQGTDSYLPTSRPLVERDVDYYGGDLRTLLDTTFAGCQAACESDPLCTAFTFNSRSQSCFPKQGVDRREPYVGALSALLRRTEAAAHDLARTRAANLSFLDPSTLAAARTQVTELTFDGQPGDDAAWLRGAIQSARADGRSQDAVAFGRRALILTDAADLWVGYARDALAVQSEDRRVLRRFRGQAQQAAINGYLRAQDAGAEAEALRLLARALEVQGRGRDGLSVLRLAERTVPGPAIAQALDAAVAKYGFRIVETRAESDGPSPRICAVFSEPLAKATDFAPYIRLPGEPFAAEADGAQLCIEGLDHGKRYRPTFRAGLPAASGERLIADATVTQYIRDRSGTVSFPGRAYVLPRGAAPVLPIQSVNADEVTLSLHRVAERNLRHMIDEGLFGRPLNAWEADRFEGELSETLWQGTGSLERVLNSEVTTLLPLDEAVADLPAGIYAMRASLPGQDGPDATQWFLSSDLGLATMQGTDGLRVTVRSLASAAPAAGVTVRLISRANRVIARAETDAKGQVTFEPLVSLGRGGAAPALLLAHTGDASAPDDFTFLSLTEPAFDLSDRGVAGRAPAGPVDVYLTTERGAYRAGETIHATVLARDDRAQAITDLPLTAVLTRPDGVEYTRLISADSHAGGHVFALPIAPSAPRGTWALAVYLDTESPALARQNLLVEDFLPERMDVTLDAPDQVHGTAPLGVSVRYLFGAPGVGLKVEGDLKLQAADGLAAWPGYRFGRHDEPFEPRIGGFAPDETDGNGQATLTLDPELPDSIDRPLEALATVRVTEGSGRPVERRVTVPVALPGTDLVVGVKPAFDGVVAEGTEARFQLVALDGSGQAQPAQLAWSLYRITRHYQWYNRYGNWAWEPLTRRTRIAQGDATTGALPIEIAAQTDWGQYELEVERTDGAYAATSLAFYAGWFAADDSAGSPDRLEVALDRAAYRTGDTAELRIVPPAPGGVVHVAVMGSRVIAEVEVPVDDGPLTVPLPVTEDWGAGAYVAATLYRPGDAAEARLPGRALGLAYAQVDPGPTRLTAAFEVPTEVRPRQPLDITLRVDAPKGETVWATIAAVDQGILNLTAHQPPDPTGHYFGQRRLGVGLRDLYGRLIDTSNGSLGRLRSGGDAATQLRMEATPPTEDLVAFFSGPVQVGPDGLARTRIDLPSFNGEVRLMAIVWSETAIGQADASVTVRDPVVLTASVPRFLSPGDNAAMFLEFVHAEGPTGPAQAQITARGLSVAPSSLALDITPGGRIALPVAITAQGATGLGEIDIALTTPGGEVLTKTLRVPVQVGDPEIARTSRFALASDTTFTLTGDLFDGLRPGTGTATVAAGAFARFDVPGLLRALDRMPYGCTEQVISQALPLLSMAPLSETLGLDRTTPTDRIAQAIATTLSRQTSGGGFGLWQSYDSDPWLDAYASDFLGRAKAAGHAVPERAMSRALDALQNRVNTAPDFDAASGEGRGLAYGLYVLAREGAATLGDLRYYADVKAEDFDTPLAKAQLGAALALYGEGERADRLFTLAEAQLDRTGTETAAVWRSDYGSRLRDAAAVLTLAAESGNRAINLRGLAERVAQTQRRLSTQEQLWTLLAARALSADVPGLTVDGLPADTPILRFDDDLTAPIALRNQGAPTDLTVTTFGVPTTPPVASGNGYDIRRSYYTMDGVPTDPSSVSQGTRLVTMLTVQPFAAQGARLMVDDPLPAGFEIDNPTLIRGGDIAQLNWLETVPTRTTEFRQDRFLAAVDWRKAEPFSLAYVVRAVTPGAYYHPAASVEDMYRPEFRANTHAGRVTITP